MTNMLMPVMLVQSTSITDMFARPMHLRQVPLQQPQTMQEEVPWLPATSLQRAPHTPNGHPFTSAAIA